MKFNAYNDDVYSIISQRAGALSQKYYHTFCGTSHLFLATLSFLTSHKDSNERYKKIFSDIKQILNKYNITGPTFEKSFLEYCPKGVEPESGSSFEITVDQEFSIIAQNLSRNAVKLQRSMEVEDLIVELFADPSYSVFTIFTDITKSEVKTEEMRNAIIQKFKKAVIPEIKELEECPELTNLNTWVQENPQTVVDADEEIRKIEMGLSGRTIKNVCLTGPAGTGKTTYVYEFAQRIVKGEVPELFADKVIYELSSTALTAGTRFRGDLEEKLMNILEIVKKHKNVILFVDELHTMMESGGSAEGSQSVGQMLKPFLTRGDIQMIAATTNEEYTKYITKDKAFASRFHEVKIAEPSRKAVKAILEGLMPVESEYFKKEIQMELIERILDMAEMYSLDQANPRKSINMLELACAYSRVFEEEKRVVDVNDVIDSIRLRYNIYISENKVDDTKEELFKVLLGQDNALNQVVRNLRMVDAGITDIDRPAMSMLLAGPTGTGKTETCKIIAERYFGSEDCLVKVACGEYSDSLAASKLTGASAGYVGYDDEPALIKGVREHPNSVVLFDEIEKASKEVQKVLLNILDTGVMTDNKGNKVSFRNCVIIFTTNLGCTKDTGKAVGMGLLKTKEEGNSSNIMKAIENYFSPEFLGRMDDIVFFNPLSVDIAEQLITRYLEEYNNRSKLNIEFSADDIADVVKASEIETRGARGIRKAVRKKLVEVLENKKKETVEF